MNDVSRHEIGTGDRTTSCLHSQIEPQEVSNSRNQWNFKGMHLFAWQSCGTRF